MNDSETFAEDFKRKRYNEAESNVELYLQRLKDAQRDLELYQRCRIEVAKRPTASRLKTFIDGRITSSFLYEANPTKDEVARVLSMYLMGIRTYSGGVFTTTYKPKGGTQRDIYYRYDNYWKILTKQSERDTVVLIFRSVTPLSIAEDEVPPF